LTPESTPAPRWLHRWALLTVCATLLNFALGAFVTTFRVGMADPVWPTYPWHLLLISWQEPSPGFLIEHSHRLAAYTVGLCSIVLAIGLWRSGGRLRWLGIAALAGVIAQGLLGGFRVRLNALLGSDLALVHGAFAQLIFALLVSIAVLAGGAGRGQLQPSHSTLRRASLLVVGLLYLQIVLGGLVRHTHSSAGPRGHLLVGFAAVAGVVWLWKLAHEQDRSLVPYVSLLAGFVALQVALGVEAWMIKFPPGVLPDSQPVTIRQGIVRTAHFLVGSVVFATAVVVALHANRRPVSELRVAPLERMEGAA
jgi:heme A synthase